VIGIDPGLAGGLGVLDQRSDTVRDTQLVEAETERTYFVPGTVTIRSPVLVTNRLKPKRILELLAVAVQYAEAVGLLVTSQEECAGSVAGGVGQVLVVGEIRMPWKVNSCTEETSTGLVLIFVRMQSAVAPDPRLSTTGVVRVVAALATVRATANRTAADNSPIR
jgi:hypothetical protein